MIRSIFGAIPLLLVAALSAYAVETDSIKTDSTKTDIVDSEKKQNLAPIKVVTPDSTTDLAKESMIESDQKVVLFVSSEPQGAVILLNDSAVGVSPLIISDVSPGNHILTLKMKGYYQKRAEVAIAPKGAQKLHFELLKPSSVYFTSDPIGAQISLNGNIKGITPLFEKTLKPGEYSVRVTSDGYKSIDSTLLLGNGSIDTVSFTMIPTEVVKNIGKTDSPKNSAKETKSTEKSKSENTEVSNKSKLKKYSGVIGAVAFGIFGIILLIGERNDL